MKLITMNVLEMKCMEDLKFLITNVDNCMLDMKLMYTNQYKEGRKSIKNLLRWMAANVEEQKLNILELTNLTCMFKDMEVVTYLFNIFDPSLFDWTPVLMSAVNSDWRSKNKDLIEWLISNVDLKYFEFNKVIQEVNEKNEHLLRLLLEKVNPVFLDFNQVMNQACRFSWIGVVAWTLHNINHALLAFKEPINAIYNSWKNDEEDGKDMENKINHKTNKKEKLIKLFLEMVNHDSLDMREILNQACRHGSLYIATLVLENAEHKNLDLMEAIHIVYNSWKHDNDDEEDDEDTHDRRDKHKPFIKLILEKVDSDLLELIFNQTCWYGCLNVVTLMLENNDHKTLNIMKAVYIVFNAILNNDDNISFQRKKYEPVIIRILEKVNHELLYLKTIFYFAVCKRCLDVVTFLLENTDHDKFDLKKTMNPTINTPYSLFAIRVTMNHKTETNESLLKLILEKVNNDSLPLKEIMNYACCNGYLDVVMFLLENIDHEKLDIMEAVYAAYRSIKNCLRNFYCDDIYINGKEIKYHFYEIFNYKYIDDPREKYESVIIQILEKVNHDLINLKTMFYLALCNKALDVVKFLLQNEDHNKLDVKKSINIAFKRWSVFALRMRMDVLRGIEERLIKLILERVNHDSLAFKGMMNYACCNDYLDVVTFLLENADHENLDIMKAVNDVYRSIRDNDYYINDRRDTYEALIIQILRKVDHGLLNLKTIFNLSLCNRGLYVVTFLLQNKDHNKLDLQKATNKAFKRWGFVTLRMRMDVIRGIEERILKLILRKVNHDSLPLKEIMNYACCNGYLDNIYFLLETTDHEKLDIMEAVNDAYRSNYFRECYGYEYYINNKRINNFESLINLFLGKINPDFLDLKTVFNQACCYGCLETVTFLLENADHKNLDIMKAVNDAYRSIRDDDYYSNDRRDTYEALIIQILEKVNHDLLNLTTTFHLALCINGLDVVTFLLVNIDHDKLNVMEALNIAFNQTSLIFGLRMYDLRGTNIKLILEKVNHDSLSLKEVMNYVCCNGYLDVVTFLLENVDHEKLNIMEAVNAAYRSMKTCYRNYDCYYHYINNTLIELFLGNVSSEFLDLKTVFNQACCHGYEGAVTFLLKNAEHEKLDIMKAVNELYRSVMEDDHYINDQKEKYEHLIIQILEKVDHDLLYLKTIFNLALFINSSVVVALLLENKDHDKLDVEEAMNKALNPGMLTFRLRMGDKRGIQKPIIQLILEKVNHDSLAIKQIMSYACCYGYLDVVTYLLENVDHKKLDIMKAVNDAYRPIKNYFRGFYGDEYYIIDKWIKALIKLFLEKVNPDLLDLNKIFHEACSNGCSDAVTFLLENTDHDKLDLLKTMNKLDLIKTTNSAYHICSFFTSRTRMGDTRGTNEPLIKLLLKKVNYHLLPLKVIMNYACCNGYLDVVMCLLQENDHENLNIIKAVNDAFISIRDDYDGDNDKIENIELLIKLILEKVNYNSLDLQERMHKVCFACLDIVTIVLEKNDHKTFQLIKQLNMVKICMDDYDETNKQRENNQYWIKLFLEEVNPDLLDLKRAFRWACCNRRLDAVTFMLENTDNKKLDVMEAVKKVCSPSVGEDTDDNFRDRNQL